MSLPSPLPTTLVEEIAERFRLLSEPMRVRILDRLREGERSVGTLVEQLDTSQQNVSKHLALLYREGILGRRKEGNRVIYWIADPSVLDLCEHVCGALDRRAAELRGLIGAAPARG